MPIELKGPTEDQSDVLGFLEFAGSYPGAPEIERIDTHAAVVFLAGDRAYKLKRAVRYDYLDFSTVELRRTACHQELAINRRAAPTLYLDVQAIARRPDGSLNWGPSGTVVDWVLVMRRFDQDVLFDRLAERDALPLSAMLGLAHAVATFHDSAETITTHGGRAGMTWVVDGNAVDLAKYADVLGRGACDAVTAACRDELTRHGELLDTRRRDGLVRRCHGDLHLRNIVLLDGRPTLFDAVEFNDEIACIDVLYDLAFLLMDLWRRRLPHHANAVFNRYLTDRDDLSGLPLLPFFLGCRAAIPAKTSATAAALQSDEAAAARLRELARDYLNMATRLLHPEPPQLIAIGGFSGTGKSTLAMRLASHVGRVPGAIVLRSDIIRKALLGVAEDVRLGQQGYAPEITRHVYATIAERTAAALAAGQSVIADAVYRESADRDGIARVADRAGVPFTGLWLEAELATLARRIETRTADASDATTAVLQSQLSSGAGAIGWRCIDAGGSADATLHAARAVLQRTLA